MNRPTLQELATDVLVRLWFRMLWQRYDLGGISVGRSKRCDLLDCYLDFVPLPNLPDGCDTYYEGLEEELFKRPVAPPPDIVSQDRIATLAKEQVALLGLGALLALEESVDSDTAWKNGYELERKRIRRVLERFQHLTVSPTDAIDDVCRALLERKSDLQYKDMLALYDIAPHETEAHDPDASL